MKKKLTKNDIEFEMFQDYWKIFQDFFTPEDNDDYWDNLLVATNKFVKKYNNGTYPLRIATAMVEEFESKFKKGENK